MKGGFADMAELLIRHGANVDVKIPESGRTPLHFCAMRNSHLAARVLIRHNCNLNPISTENNEMKTPLHKAIDTNHIAMTTELVHSGANLNAICQHELTPLMLTMMSNISHKAILVRVLLQGGCDVNMWKTKYSYFEVALQLDQKSLTETGNVLMMQQQLDQVPYSVMLLLAGYRLSNEEVEAARQFFSHSESHRVFCAELTDPRTLKHNARIVIRKLMTNVTPKKVKSLDIPETLKDFLLLRDIF